MAENLLGESFLATVGPDAFLDPGPIAVLADQRDRALRYPDLMRAEVRSFLENGTFDRGAPLPAFNYRKVLAQLNDFPTEPEQQVQHLTEKLAGFRVAPDAAIAFSHAAGRAVQFLQNVVPRRQRVLSTGPVLVPPNAQELSRFRRAHATVQDPMSLFSDLREGQLMVDQVKAFEAVYPALYKAAKVIVGEELARLKAQRNAFALGHGKERMLQRFMGVDKTDPKLTRALQESFRPGRDITQGPNAPATPSDPGQAPGLTPTQRVAAK